ncbi:MAG: hypothetical protein A3J65_04430 [Candidatus Buchananbacteria bacterium RIFCSPHIGHO2_02_FULL_45_11b]|uniref:NodB homology domain-containing protein n=1 Tax=Candidatus Buchananbacteria bacterium RIFCSPHIGHO2_02_FULL_45_11b TaxID=1797541 RepID=A0A1G1YDA2_9BACT|nr:MAG: hypothetical protein A3J65_04430 [Candidatus Buchananbacteria bacterium RIFCSPHIGHO2_02_FULL_45_11b]
MIFTSSWDDGDRANIRLKNLLNKYDLKGTFYINGDYLADKNNRPEIIEISRSQEIGAHTYNHSDLTRVELKKADEDIKLGKTALEELLNRPIDMFCYPYGFFNQAVKEMAKKNGFLGARTTKRFVFNRPIDFFEFGTTTQIYPYPFRKKDAIHYHGPKAVFQPLLANYPAILKYKLAFNSFFNWFNLSKNLFDYGRKNGEIFHLWGHSREIEKYGLWNDLEIFFKYIKNFKEMQYLTNSQCLKYFNENPAD